MKKKAYLAILALCVVLGASACGTETGETTEQTQNTETEKNDKEKPSSYGTRLVSVKDVDKYITIGEYKGIQLDKTVAEITEEEVDAQISNDLKNKAEEVTDKNGTVENGDLVTINFVGTKDGETFDGGTANNYDLTIGEGMMIDGFEDGIIGMKKGETKEVPLTFPEDYYEPSMAGADVVFKITLQNFRRTPELSEEWVAANTDYKTLEEYREGTRKTLAEAAEQSAQNNLQNTAWGTVIGNCEVKEYPQDDIDNAVAEYKKLNEEYAAQGDMDLEKFVESQGLTMEAFEEQCQQYTEAKVKQNLVVQGIMDKEGLTLEDEESLKIQNQLIEQFGVKDLADLVDQYGQVAVDESIGILRVTDFIVDQAEIKDMVANGDTVGVDGEAGAEDAEEETEEETEEEAAE